MKVIVFCINNYYCKQRSIGVIEYALVYLCVRDLLSSLPLTKLYVGVLFFPNESSTDQ